MRKNYICLLVLFFVMFTFFVVKVDAQYRYNHKHNKNNEGIKKETYLFLIPIFIKDKYLIKMDPDQCLIPVEAIIIPGCERQVGIVPYVTVAEKRLLDTGVIPKNFEVTIEAIICVCENHIGNRLIIMRKLDKKGDMQVIYKNPDDPHEEIKKVKPLPKNMS